LQELQHVGGVVDMGAGAGGFAGAGGDAGNISDGSVGAVPDTGGCGVVAARHPDHGFGQGGSAAEMRGLSATITRSPACAAVTAPTSPAAPDTSTSHSTDMLPALNSGKGRTTVCGP